MLIYFLVLAIFHIASCYAETPCVLGGFKKLHSALCSQKDLDSIPQDLDKKIRLLDMSSNHVYEIKSDSFSRYSRLVELVLADNKIEEVADDAFSSLTDLETLNLRFNDLSRLPTLPASVVTLDLSGNRKLFASTSSSVSFANLKSLKKLSMQTMKLKKFPNLTDVGGNLVELDLRKNPELTEFGVSDVASLCKLKTLFVGNVNQNNSFEMTGDECSCLAVLKWIQVNEIGGVNLACRTKTKSTNCGDISLEEYEKVRTNCQWESKLKTVRYFCIVGGIILLLVLFCICVLCCCRRWKSRRN